MRRKVKNNKIVNNDALLSECNKGTVELELAWREGVNSNGWEILKDDYISALKTAIETMKVIPILDHSIKPYGQPTSKTRSSAFNGILGCVTEFDFDKMTAIINLKDDIENIGIYDLGFVYTAEVETDTNVINNISVVSAALIKKSLNTYKI